MGTIEINAFQINIIQNYKLSLFPEDRIKALISELSVHYEKINKYIEIDMAEDKINFELVDIYAKLKEIMKLSTPTVTISDPNSDDYKFATDLIESILALHKLPFASEKMRDNLAVLGWELLTKIHNDLIGVTLITSLNVLLIKECSING